MGENKILPANGDLKISQIVKTLPIFNHFLVHRFGIASKGPYTSSNEWDEIEGNEEVTNFSGFVECVGWRF